MCAWVFGAFASHRQKDQPHDISRIDYDHFQKPRGTAPQGGFGGANHQCTCLSMIERAEGEPPEQARVWGKEMSMSILMLVHGDGKGMEHGQGKEITVIVQ